VSGDRIETVLPTVLAELEVALNQREQAIRVSQTNLPAPSGLVISTAKTNYLDTLRSRIEAMASGGTTGFGEFVKNDLTSFVSVADFMSYSGIGAWDTDYRISNKNLWTQIQTAFSYLKKFKTHNSPAVWSPGVDMRIQQNSEPSAQAAWTACISRPLELGEVVTVWRTTKAGVYWGARIEGAEAAYNLDLTLWPLGDHIQTVLTVNRFAHSDALISRDFHIATSAWTLAPGENVTWDITLVQANFPVTMGAIKSFSLFSDTAVPATIPFNSPSSGQYFESKSALVASDNAHVYADLTADLTYG